MAKACCVYADPSSLRVASSSARFSEVTMKTRNTHGRPSGASCKTTSHRSVTRTQRRGPM